MYKGATTFIIGFIFWGFLFISNGYGQTMDSSQGKDENWLRYAEKSFQEKDYYGAAYYYTLALEEDSLDLDIRWAMAESYRLSFAYNKAQKSYQEVIEFDEKVKYPESTFYLAEMLKMQGKYEEAGQYFSFYKEICKDRTNPLYRRTKNEIKACVLAESWKTMTPLWNVEHAPFGLNSFDAEFAPVVQNDSSILFSALRFDTLMTKQLSTDADIYKSKIFHASLINDNWEALPFPSEINDSLSDNANPSINADSSIIYFTRCDDNGCDIYFSKRKDEIWLTPEKLGPNINDERSNSTHPYAVTLKNGKSYLFFSSNRSRTRGGMDIWSVEVKNNGQKYGRPKNAGRRVNTKGDEITPFYDAPTEMLFFSSKWHPGFGGFDVFKSKGLPGKTQEPRNLGIPVNSSVNDMYYNYRTNQKFGTFVSNRSDGYALKGETCCNDIYFIKPIDTNKVIVPANAIPVEEDLMVRLQAVEFLPLPLYFDNDRPNPRTKETSTELNYEETYLSYMERQPQFQKNAPKKPPIDSFFVNDLKVGYLKIQMLSDSIAKYLDMGYKLQLGIKGYTSPLGDAEYNDNLALRRINSIENYFATHSRLKQAINQGLLTFQQIPFGEFFSEGKVNDDRKSTKQSVYSTDASLARKVEIMWVEQKLPTDSNATIQFTSSTYNFGELKTDQEFSHSFEFTNSGEIPLLIDDVVTNCPCVVANYPNLIEPGESGEIKITFNTSGRKGLQFHAIIVNSNASTTEKKLFIRGVMEVKIPDPEEDN